MARPSKLRKETTGNHTYWVASIRGRKRSFGNVKTTSQVEAQAAFADALKGASDGNRGDHARITSHQEYENAQDELADLQSYLERLEAQYPVGVKGFTKAGIRKLIARLHEDLAVFEGSAEARSAPNS